MCQRPRANRQARQLDRLAIDLATAPCFDAVEADHRHEVEARVAKHALFQVGPDELLVAVLDEAIDVVPARPVTHQVADELHFVAQRLDAALQVGVRLIALELEQARQQLPILDPPRGHQQRRGDAGEQQEDATTKVSHGYPVYR